MICSFCRFDTALVSEVGRDVLHLLGNKPLYEVKHAVGLSSRVAAVQACLERASVVVLKGMGGIGKSTLATAVYNSISEGFDCHFRIDVGQTPDISSLQKEVLKRFGKGLDRPVLSGQEGKQLLKDVLWSKKFLLMIDDVWSPQDLAALLPEPAVFPKAKVLITTRKEGILAWLEDSLSQAEYDVGLLSDEEALELFCWHAFRAEEPSGIGHNDLQLALTAGGNLPLALEVLGSHGRQYVLHNLNREEWAVSCASHIPTAPLANCAPSQSIVQSGKNKMGRCFFSESARKDSCMINVANRGSCQLSSRHATSFASGFRCSLGLKVCPSVLVGTKGVLCTCRTHAARFRNPWSYLKMSGFWRPSN
jgi:hypothetical protein